jgi:hypothetical protein
MAATLFLNATCVAIETTNYTLINPTTFNQTTCVIEPPAHRNWWTGLRIFGVITACLLVTLIVVSFAVHSRYLSTLEYFRSLPSYELHEAIERTYESTLLLREQAAFESHEKGRYKSVTHADNATDGTRTVTVVEDLTKTPMNKLERYELMRREWKEGKIVRSPPRDLGRYTPSPRRGNNTTTQAAPAASLETQQMDSPVTNLGSLVVDFLQTRTTRNQEALEEMDTGEAPPPYTHH